MNNQRNTFSAVRQLQNCREYLVARREELHIIEFGNKEGECEGNEGMNQLQRQNVHLGGVAWRMEGR